MIAATSAHRAAFARIVTYGFAAAFVSSLGQTFFISLFVPSLKSALFLDAAQIGTVYGLATLAGVTVLPAFGRWFDRTDLLRFASATTLIMGLGCLALVTTHGIVQLFVAFALLRLAGPGLLAHLASAGPARYFVRGRGLALSVSGLGYTLGEALLPGVAVRLVAATGWRPAFALAGAAACLVLTPCAAGLVRESKRFRRRRASPATHEQHGLSPRALFRRIWHLLPLLLAPAALETGLIFHEGAIAEAKHLSLAVFATGFVVYALVQVPASLVAGRLIDRFGSLPVLLGHAVPMAAGALVLAISDRWWAAWIFLGGTGLTAAANTLLRTTVALELVGPKLVGEARARLSSLFVLANSASPMVLGFLISPGRGPLSVLLSSAACLGIVIAIAASRAAPSRPLRFQAPSGRQG